MPRLDSQPWGEAAEVPSLCPCQPGPCPILVPRGTAAHTVNTTPFLQGHLFFIHGSLGPGFPYFGLSGVSVVAPRHSELSFKDIFQSCSPRDPQGGLCLPTWLLTGWRGRTQDWGASLSLISVKFSFWKGRSGKGCICSAMVGGRHRRKPPGGLMWLLLEPTDLSRSCWCSHFLP